MTAQWPCELQLPVPLQPASATAAHAIYTHARPGPAELASVRLRVECTPPRPRHRLSRPHPAGTSAYQADFDLVKALGRRNGSARSTYETAAAPFWVGYGSQVTGLWVNTLLAQPQVAGWGLEASARFFARLGSSYHDAAVACWHLKFATFRWRPVTAIRCAAPGACLVAGRWPGWVHWGRGQCRMIECACCRQCAVSETVLM